MTDPQVLDLVESVKSILPDHNDEQIMRLDHNTKYSLLELLKGGPTL